MLGIHLVALFVSSLVISVVSDPPYKPDWDSLDKRPIPPWFDDVKFGIFIFWGVYAVPSFKHEWFWWNWKSGAYPDYVEFMNKNYKPGFSYTDFAPMFTAEFFNADEWADMFARSGAKYMVFSTKHHDGYTMWPSNTSWSWNSVDVGPHRDIVGELEVSTKKRNLTFGLYFSQYEWYNPIYIQDAKNHYKTKQYPKMVSIPQMNELIMKYKPELFWSDGDWDTNDEYWSSKEFLAWLYNDSPVKDTIVVNDRWGYGSWGKHGDYYTFNDKYNPGVLQNHKWECCMNIYTGSFGYDRLARAEDYRSTKECINILLEVVSCGGNLLLNVAPALDGKIVPIFEERLLEIGQWLKVNGEAIYETKPWIIQNDTATTNIWYTSKVRQSKGLNPRRLSNPQNKLNTVVYATFFDWPKSGLLKLGSPIGTGETKIQLLGTDIKLNWTPDATGKGIIVDLGKVAVGDLPSFVAWTLKLENLKSQVSPVIVN